MNIYPMATHLQAEGLGTEGQDLFVHHMPARVERGILLMVQTPIMRHEDIDNYRKGEFQAIVRHTDRQAGYSLASQVADTLKVQDLTLGNMLFKFIHPIHDPLVYPRSEGNGLEFSVNFKCAFLITS